MPLTPQEIDSIEVAPDKQKPDFASLPPDVLGMPLAAGEKRTPLSPSDIDSIKLTEPKSPYLNWENFAEGGAAPELQQKQYEQKLGEYRQAERAQGIEPVEVGVDVPFRAAGRALQRGVVHPIQAGLQDLAETAAGNPTMRNMVAVSNDEQQTPFEKATEDVHGIPGMLKNAAQAIPDVVTRATAGRILMGAGMNPAVADGISFGTSEEKGLDPVQGLIIAGIGKASQAGQDFANDFITSSAGQRLTEAALGKPRAVLNYALEQPGNAVKLALEGQYRGMPWLTPGTVQQAVKTIGGIGSVNLYLDAVATVDALGVPEDKRAQYIKDAFASNLALSAMALPEALSPIPADERVQMIDRMTPEQRTQLSKVAKVLNKGLSLGDSPEGQIFKNQADLMAAKYGFKIQKGVGGQPYDPNAKVAATPTAAATTYPPGYKGPLTQQLTEGEPSAPTPEPNQASVPVQRAGTDEVGQTPPEAGAGNRVPSPAGQPAEAVPQAQVAPAAQEEVKPLTLAKGDEIPVEFAGLWHGTQMPTFKTTAPVVSPESGKVQPAGSTITGALIGKYGLTVPPAEQVKADAAVKAATPPPPVTPIAPEAPAASGRSLQPKPTPADRTTIDTPKDESIGKNAAGESIFKRDDGSVYRMRFDRKDKPNGYPDFGGDLTPAQAPLAPKPVEKVPVAQPPVKATATDNGVRDHPQQVRIDGDTIHVTHKVGREKAGGFSFPLSEWLAADKGPSVNPHFNRAQVVLKYTKDLDEQPGGEGQAQRIRDSIVNAIKTAYAKTLEPLPKGATQIDRSQADALVGGLPKLLPALGETKPQPQDTTGEYFIGRTKDGRFFTQHIPKAPNEQPTAKSPEPAAPVTPQKKEEPNANQPAKGGGSDLGAGGKQPATPGEPGQGKEAGAAPQGQGGQVQPGVRKEDEGAAAAGRGPDSGKPDANVDRVPDEQKPDAAVTGAGEPRPEGTGSVSGQPAGASGAAITPFVEPGHKNIVLSENPAPTGPTARVKANIDAIALLKQLEAENRFPTDEERMKLAAWSGWGSFKELFNQGRAEKRDWDQGWMKKYGSAYDKLVKLLTPEEFHAAAMSSVNAHYTSIEAVRSMWDIVRRLGYKGGRALEPSTGSGVFIGYGPEDLLASTKWTGVEMEPITGKIFSYLYPEVDMRIQPFQKAKLPNAFYDLVITNVPFHETGPGAEYPSLNLHNYFIARALDKTKPGGLVVVITTKGSMDQQQEQRNLLNDKGQLIGAIRLPNDAFQESAATEVVTDILVLRKPDGKPFDLAQAWKNTEEVQTAKGPTRVNEYFAAHPDMVLGEHALTGTMYQKDSYTVNSSGNLKAKLEKAIASLPENVTQQEATPESLQPSQTTLEDYSLVIKDGKVMESRNFQLEAPKWDTGSPGLIHRAKLYIALRDRLKSQYRMELDPASTDEQIEANRKLLRKEYEAMCKELSDAGKKGTVNQSDRKMAHLTTDPDYYTVMGIEVFKEIADPKDANNTITIAEPSDVLSKRVNQPDVPPEKAANASEAMAVSLAYKGEVDIGYIQKLTGLSQEQVESELISGGMGFKDPETGLFSSGKEYLTGDVRDKLQKAIFAAKEANEFAPNVEALKKVIPETVPFNRIAFNITARWLPPAAISRYAEVIIGLNRNSISFVPGVEQFMVANHRNSFTEKAATQWSTADMHADALLDHALNFKRAKIMRRIAKDQYEEDKDASALNNQMIDRMIREFSEWSRTNKDTLPYKYFDSNRGEYVSEELPIWDVLEREYNRTKNSFIVPENDGSMLKLPGLSNMVRRTPHLMNGVMRAIVDGSAVFGHGTGSGKTYLLTVISHELKRIGLMKKDVLVVKKPTVGQYRVSIERAYPGSKVLLPSKKDFEPANRRTLAARIASGKWDFIILTHEQFKAIRTTEASTKAFFDDQISQLQQILRDMGEENAIGQTNTRGMDPAVRNIVRKIMGLQRRLDKITTAMGRHQDTGLHWEDLGIDGVLIDESHNFKKMPIPTQMDNVKGIPSDYSQRAVDLLIKLRDVQRKTNGRNVFFASGTPVSNTLAELWVMFHATNPKMLDQFGVKTFDSFATTFADVVSNFEFGWDDKFKDVTRMARFKNPGALTTLTRLGMDVRIGNKELGLDVPDMENNKPTVRIIKPTAPFERWRDLLNDIVTAWEELDPRGRFENSWVPIATMRAGVAAALDPRCLFADAADDPESKVNQCIRDIMKEWEDGKEKKTTMMVFADMYRRMNTEKILGFVGHQAAPEPTELDVPDEPDKDEGDPSDTGKKDDADFEKNAVGTFNLYEDIRTKLVKLGVPIHEIAIIGEHDTDTKRESLFNKVRAGIVRILLGSTEKIGEGVDVPQRMSAQFHLDPPMQMTPAKMEQRLGRIIRQGNLHSPNNWNLPVRVNFYASEKSMDAAIYQMLEEKSIMVLQALKGQYLGDSFEDPAGALTLAMAEMKAAATGDTRVLEMAKLQKEVRELSAEHGAFLRRHSELERSIEDGKRSVTSGTRDAAKYKAIADAMQTAWGDEQTAFLKYKDKTIVGYKAIDEWLESAQKSAAQALVKEKDAVSLLVKIGDNLYCKIEGNVYKQYGGTLATNYSATFYIGQELNYGVPRWDSSLNSIESVLNAGRNVPKNAEGRIPGELRQIADGKRQVELFSEQLSQLTFDKTEELNQKRDQLRELESTLRREGQQRKQKRLKELFPDEYQAAPVYSRLLQRVTEAQTKIEKLNEKWDKEKDIDKRDKITEVIERVETRLKQLQKRLDTVESARLANAKAGKESGYRQTVNKRDVKGAIGDGRKQVAEGKAVGVEDIRKLVNDPKAGLDADTVKVVNAMLDAPAFKNADWSTLKLELTNRMKEGIAASTVVADNLIKLSGAGGPQMFPHEAFHLLYEFLPPEARAAIERKRLQALTAIYVKDIPENLRNGTMTTAEFLASSLPRNQYPLINTGEFLSEFASKRFTDDTLHDLPPRDPQTESWWRNLKAMVRRWLAELVKILRRIAKRPDMEGIYSDLLSGRYKATPETGAKYEAEKGSLARTPQEYKRRTARGEVGTPEGTVAGYASLAKMKYDTAVQLRASDKAMSILNLPHQIEMSNLGFSDTGIDNYYDIRDRVAKIGNGVIIAEVALSAFRALGEEQYKYLDLVTKAKEQLARISSPGFTAAMKRWAGNEIKLEGLAGAEETFVNQMSQEAGAIVKQMNETKVTDAKFEALKENLNRLKDMPQFSKAVAQRVENMVQVLSGHPESLKILLYGSNRSGTDLANKFFSMSSAAGNTISNTEERAFYELAAQVLAANRDVARKLSLVAYAKANPLFQAAVTKAGKVFANKLETDPQAAIKGLMATAQRLTEARTNAEAAWLMLNKKLLKEIDLYNDRQKAVEVMDALRDSPDWKKLVNDVNSDMGGKQYTDEEKKTLTKDNALDSFHGRPVLVAPDGNVYKLNFGFDPKTALAAAAQTKNLLNEIEAWIGNPFNKDSPDMKYWQDKRDFVEGVYYAVTTTRPSSVTPLGVRHSFTIPDYFFSQVTFPQAKIAQIAFENASAAWSGLEGWTKNNGPKIVNENAIAIRRHKWSSDYDAKKWQDNILSQMGWLSRAGQKMTEGHVLDNGYALTKQDIKAFKEQGGAIHDLFTMTLNAGREKVMKDRVLIDEYEEGMFGVRKPMELGAEPGTTLPRVFSDRGKTLSRLVSEAIDAGKPMDSIISIIDQQQNWSFIKNFCSIRKYSYLPELSPYETQYGGYIAANKNSGENWQTSVGDLVDYVEANSTGQTRDEIKAQIYGEMTGFLKNLYDKFLKKEGETTTHAWRSDATSALTRGYQDDVAPSFFYDYGVLSEGDVRALANDAFSVHLAAVDKALDSLENEATLALMDLPKRTEAATRKEFLKDAAVRFQAGEDFRNFDALEKQLIEIRNFRKMLSAFSGKSTVEAYMAGRGSRLVTDVIGARLSGATTSGRILVGSIVKTAQTFAAMDRGMFVSSLKGIVAMGMSTAKVGFPVLYHTVGKVASNAWGIASGKTELAEGGMTVKVAEMIKHALEGVTEDVMRPTKYLQMQHQLGMVPDQLLGHKIANIIMMTQSRGRGYAPVQSNNKVIKIGQNIINRILAGVEVPLEIIHTYLPQLAYNIAYDAAARQAGWTIDVLESAARRAYDVHEKIGTIKKYYNLDDPGDPINRLVANEVLPKLFFPKGQTALAQTREWFRALDISYDEVIIKFWKRLSVTPKADRGKIRLLSAEETDVAKAGALAERRAAALMMVALRKVHHSSFGNRPWIIRDVPVLRWVNPFLGWSSESTRATFSTIGYAPAQARWLAFAHSLVTILALAGVAIVIGDADKRFFSWLKWVVEGERTSVKHLGEGETFGENVKIAISDMTAFIPLLNTFVNSILGIEASRGGNSFYPLLLGEANAFMDLVKGMISTGDFTYGVARFLGQQVPLIKGVVNRLPSQAGLLEAKNVKADMKRFGPLDLQRTPDFGTQVPTPLSPYKEALANAVFSKDSDKIKEAFDAFVQKATEIGRPDAQKLGQQVFESLNPYHQVFGTTLTDEQRQVMLDKMPADVRQEVEAVERKYTDAASELSFRAAFTKEEAQSDRPSGAAAPGTPGAAPDFTQPIQAGLRAAGARGAGGVGNLRGIGGVGRSGGGGRSFVGRYGRVGTAKPRAGRGLVRGTRKGTGRGTLGRRPRSLTVSRGLHA